MNRIEHHLTADSAKLDPSRFFLLSQTLDLHHSTPQHRIDPSIMFPEKMSANATEWRFPSLGPFARDHFPFISGLSFCISHSLDVACNHLASHADDVVPCGPPLFVLPQVLLPLLGLGVFLLCWHKHHYDPVLVHGIYPLPAGLSNLTLPGGLTPLGISSSWLGLENPAMLRGLCLDVIFGPWISTCFYDVAGEMVLTIVLAPCLHFEMSTTCL